MAASNTHSSYRDHPEISVISIRNQESQEAYTHVKERLIVLELEKEETVKSLEILKQIRIKDKQESQTTIQAVKQEAALTAEQIK